MADGPVEEICNLYEEKYIEEKVVKKPKKKKKEEKAAAGTELIQEPDKTAIQETTKEAEGGADIVSIGNSETDKTDAQ